MMAWALVSTALLACIFQIGDALPQGCDASLLGPEVCDSSLSANERAAALVAQLTLDEKIQQLNTFSFDTEYFNGYTPGIERLGVSPWNYHTECLHGLRTAEGSCNITTTLFPQVTAMAATFNLSLVYGMAAALGKEVRTCNNVAAPKVFTKGGGLSVYAPTMNVYRDPRWGRGQESVSEDPTLNGDYAVNFVRGIQGMDAEVFDDDDFEGGDEGGEGGDTGQPPGLSSSSPYLLTAATCKHMAAYSFEGNSSKAAVNRHNFDAVVSQQDLDETYLPAFEACVTRGFPTQIMCSYNAVNGVPACLDASLQQDLLRKDWGFQGSVVADCDAVYDAYAEHHYNDNESSAQVAADSILGGCDQDCGDFTYLHGGDAVDEGRLQEQDVDTSLVRVLAMRFQLGEFEDPSAVQPYASYTAQDDSDTLQNRELALEAARQSIVLLNNSVGLLPLAKPESTSVAVVGPFANATAFLMGEKDDFSPPYLISFHRGLLGFTSGGGVSDDDDGSGGHDDDTVLDDDDDNDTVAKKTKKKGSKAPAARAAAAAAAGDDDPACPFASVSVALGCGDAKCQDLVDSDSFKEAVAVAAEADVAVVTLGIDGTIEKEALDRTDIGLPGNQLALLQQIVAARGSAEGVVVVLVSGGSVSSTWVKENTPTVLEVFEGGQSGGVALKEVITGDTNPSGRLPFTVYPEDYISSVNMEDMSMQPNAATGAPGRTYRYYEGTPLWPFGFGGSFTTFEYDLREGISKRGNATVKALEFNFGAAAAAAAADKVSNDSESSSPSPLSSPPLLEGAPRGGVELTCPSPLASNTDQAATRKQHGLTLKVGVTNVGTLHAGAHSLLAFVEPPNTYIKGNSNSNGSTAAAVAAPDLHFPRTALRSFAKTRGTLAASASGGSRGGGGSRQVLRLRLRCTDFWDWREDATAITAVGDGSVGSKKLDEKRGRRSKMTTTAGFAPPQGARLSEPWTVRLGDAGGSGPALKVFLKFAD